MAHVERAACHPAPMMDTPPYSYPKWVVNAGMAYSKEIQAGL